MKLHLKHLHNFNIPCNINRNLISNLRNILNPIHNILLVYMKYSFNALIEMYPSYIPNRTMLKTNCNQVLICNVTNWIYYFIVERKYT
jgi:hypothetical protein